jgi:hypothetical protein
MLKPALFAPVQLYILLAITIATLGWLWPKDGDGLAHAVRLNACWVLILLEVLHLIVSNVTEVPRYIAVPAHVLLLLGYATLMGELLYGQQRRRVDAPRQRDLGESS